LRNPAQHDEVVRSTSQTRSTITRRARAGRLRRIVPGLYTSNLTGPLETIVDRNLLQICGMYFPGAVIVDRSVRTGGRPVEGHLFVDHRRPSDLLLPGVTIVQRSSLGPLPGDMELPYGLHLSSIARALLDNSRRTRSHPGRVRRTMTRQEVETWLEHLYEQQGEEGLLKIRREMDDLAPALAAEAERERLGVLIGGMLGTRPEARAMSEPMRARLQNRPYDAKRLELFVILRDALTSQSLPVRPVSGDRRQRFLPFYEAYFSNFIEGTEFTLEEAENIVLQGNVPAQRPADAHDIIGTYQLVNDPAEMSLRPSSADGLVELLVRRHAVLMGGRPEKAPGAFKERPNQAGPTQFVEPELLRGTLERGFKLYEQVFSPFGRAVMMMFVVAEVHPFADGNGRLARVMMNAELVGAGEHRIIIPSVYRSNYLSALKALTHNRHPDALIATMDFAQRYVATIDFSDLKAARRALTATNAFIDPATGDLESMRLKLPLQDPRVTL